MEEWVGEEDPERGVKLLLKLRDVRRVRTAKFRALVGDHPILGRVLVFEEDGRRTIQVAERFDVYSEVLVHVAMCAHPNPRRVLIIGGGDGSTLREVLKHECVEHVTLCEIDRDVVRVGRELLRVDGGALADPRVTFVFEDGARYVSETDERFDVCIVDITDPYPGTPAASLATEDFFRSVKRVLGERGILSFQSGSPILQPEVTRRIYSLARKFFTHVRLCVACVPFYPLGIWAFTFASDSTDPRVPRRRFTANFYSDEIHSCLFVLPPMIRRLIDCTGSMCSPCHERANS